MKKKENNYISPSVEVFDMMTEKGFASSSTPGFNTPNWDGDFDGDEIPIS